MHLLWLKAFFKDFHLSMSVPQVYFKRVTLYKTESVPLTMIIMVKFQIKFRTT